MTNLRPFTEAARYHVVGLTETGPFNTATLISTGTQYTATFGRLTTGSAPLYNDVGLYFAEGGQEVHVTRVPDMNPATVKAALSATGEDTRGAAVAVPGGTAAALGVTLANHAEEYGKLALLCGGKDTTVAQLAATAQFLKGRPGSETTAIFWPWVTRGRTIQAPTGYVAAVRARAHLAHGYWKHPDGPDSRARTVTGLRTPNTPARNEELSEQLISPLVTTRDGSVHLHGWWSLSGDRANFPYLDTTDMLNNLAADLGRAYESVTRHAWDTVPKLRSQVAAITKGRLASLANAGAFNKRIDPSGSQSDPGYVFTVTEPEAQPPDRNVIIVRVAVRPYTHANLISVRVFQVPILDPFPAEVTL